MNEPVNHKQVLDKFRTDEPSRQEEIAARVALPLSDSEDDVGSEGTTEMEEDAQSGSETNVCLLSFCD
mgnify:FL=1